MKKKELQGLQKTVTTILKTLSPRNRDIIARRFGLLTGKRETLESIGSSYQITRERVRQIEEFTLNQLAKGVQENKDIQKYVSLVKSVLQKDGGLMREDHLFEAVSGNARYDATNAALVFVLSLGDEIVRGDENDRFHAYWALSNKDQDSFQESTSSLISAMKKESQPVPVGQLESFVTHQTGNGVADRRLNTVLAVSKEISQNIFGEVGLASWPEIRPKGVRDKAYLVMKKEGQPRHFGEIASLINKAGFDNKKVNVQTVHNELIKDNRFVLVGRGMYALSEWGYKAGTVKDVLVDILRTSSRPLSRADLIAKVQRARLVKENTIVLNLQDSSQFVRNDDGTYHLRKA
ncbi:MAG: hypothetical protein KW806_01130 [Candidatus Yanofskybacteria bacterium]|nr:hypothetical protein [Candidatus Yanofskybacteria bacterium]